MSFDHSTDLSLASPGLSLLALFATLLAAVLGLVQAEAGELVGQVLGDPRLAALVVGIVLAKLKEIRNF